MGVGGRGWVRVWAAPCGFVPLSGAASSPALAPSRFHVSDFKGSGLRGFFYLNETLSLTSQWMQGTGLTLRAGGAPEGCWVPG